MVPKSQTLADVGCDHGYLTIALLEGQVVDKAIAMDVNKGPLASAKANISQANLTDKVSFRLSDGLAKLKVDEADVICICGMGGALIQRILSSQLSVARSAECLILEPQSEYRMLREFLAREHSIIDEMLCTEEGKIYPIMKVSFCPNMDIQLSELELEYGPVIIENRPKLLKALMEKNKNEYSSILKKLEEKKDVAIDSPIQKRKEELSEELSLIRQLELEMEEKSHG